MKQTPTPKDLAAGLSEAQRAILCAMSARPKSWLAVQRHAKVKTWPWMPRDVVQWRRDDPFRRATIALTPLGLAVRAILLSGETPNV